MSASAMAGEGRAKGVVLVAASAVLFASAGVFTKLIPSDAWTILFWRGLVAAAFLAGLMTVARTFGAEVLRMGRSGVLAAGFSTLGSVAFIPAFKETTVANVTLIYTSAPFIAAFVAWAWIGERPSRRCLAAAVGALAGVAMIFGAPSPGVSLRGDLLALWMTLCMAVVMVIYRRRPKTPVFGPIALSSVLVLPAAMMVADPLAVPAGEIPMLSGFGICFALAAVGLMAGARLLPSAEAALLSLLETPLAPLLAWALLAETPSLRCLAGGVVIVVSLIWYLRRPGQDRPQSVSTEFENPTI